MKLPAKKRNAKHRENVMRLLAINHVALKKKKDIAKKRNEKRRML